MKSVKALEKDTLLSSMFSFIRKIPTVWFALLVIMVVARFFAPRFFNPYNLVNILRQAVPLGLVAMGITLTMLGGGVDLSGASIASLAAVIGAGIMAGDNGNIIPAVVFVIIIGGVIGLINGILVTKLNLPPFILTLATGMSVNGIVKLISGGTAYGVLAPAFREVLNSRIGIIPVLVIIFAFILLIFILIQQKTTFGRQLYLIGGNQEAARLSGLKVHKVKIISYFLSAILAGIAGIMLLARYGVTGTSTAAGYSFEALAAVVLGGTSFRGGRGGLGRTFAGVIILMVAFNLVNILGFNYHWQLIVRGSIIIAAATAYGGLKN